MSNGFRYTGNGKRFRGVPVRDLTQQEYDALGPREQRSVVESGAYEAVQLIDFNLDDLKAMAIEAGGDQEAVNKIRNKADVIKLINESSVPATSPGTTTNPNNQQNQPSQSGKKEGDD